MRVKHNSQVDDAGDSLLQRGPNPRQRILVVEDDATIRRVNTEVLTCSGYHVDTAEDGAAAWDTLQLNNYDLMVTDHDMPKMTGVQLIQKLQSARMALPVIMATGTVPHDELNRCQLLQPAKTLIKPYTFHELLDAVKEVLFDSNQGREEIVPPPHWRAQSLPNLSEL